MSNLEPTVSQRLQTLLEGVGGELIGATTNGQQITVNIRVPVTNSAPRKWKDFVDILARDVETTGGVDISKTFFAKQGVTRFCWRLIFQSTRLQDFERVLGNSVKKAIRARQQLTPVKELTSFPLVGARMSYREGDYSGKGPKVSYFKTGPY